MKKGKRPAVPTPKEGDDHSVPSSTKGQTHIFDFKHQQGKMGEGKDQHTKAGTKNWDVGEGIILVDTREFNSAVVKELSRMGYTIRSELLDVADYILSDRIGIERKTVDDFIASLKDGRLFQQLGWMKGSFTRPVVIIEGEGLIESGGMAPASIFGAVASIVADYGIPVVQTRNDLETATLIASISKREYAEARPTAARVDIGATLLEERQRFLVEGLPNVSAVLARRLLDHFGSVKAVMTASEEELTQVKGVGKKIAKQIVRVMEEGYLRKKEE